MNRLGRMGKAIGAQWLSTTLEFLRSKLYVGLLAAGLLLVAAAASLAQLSLGETVSALTDIGMAFVALTVATLGGAVTVSSVSHSITSREIIVLLARPVGRDAFIVARFLSSATLIVAANVILGGVLAALVGLLGGPALSTFLATVFASFEGIVVASVALAFAARSAPVLSASLTTVVFVLGRMDGAFELLLSKGTFGFFEQPMRVVHHVLPQLSRFDLTSWVHGDAPTSSVLWSVAYGLIYSLTMVTVASLRFRNRDIL
jgi:ABC-type transport system involved in multi-copper enzyme maturation permease subunit